MSDTSGANEPRASTSEQAEKPKPTALDRLLEHMDRHMHSPIHQMPKGGVLYHYTDAAGLLGILKNQALRATDYQFLNDREEISVGEQLVAQRLKHLQRETGDPAQEAQLEGRSEIQ